MTITFRAIACFAYATIERDGHPSIEVSCQFPGGRPSVRVVPYSRATRGPAIEDAPVCHTFEQFETWVHATYGG